MTTKNGTQMFADWNGREPKTERLRESLPLLTLVAAEGRIVSKEFKFRGKESRFEKALLAGRVGFCNVCALASENRLCCV
jgi:hypothetical protein